MSETQEERNNREAEEYASAPRCAQVTPDDKAWHRLKAAYLSGLCAERARWSAPLRFSICVPGEYQIRFTEGKKILERIR